MPLRKAFGAAAGGGLDIFSELADQFDSHDSSGNGDNGITHDHHQGGDHLSGDGVGCDVAVSHSRDRHDGPVDGLGNTCELVWG